MVVYLLFSRHISCFLQWRACDRFSAWSCSLKRALYNTSDSECLGVLYIPFIHSRHNAKDMSQGVGRDMCLLWQSLLNICITPLLVVCSLRLPKIIEFCLRIQMLPAKNVSWPHCRWPTLYNRIKCVESRELRELYIVKSLCNICIGLQNPSLCNLSYLHDVFRLCLMQCLQSVEFYSVRLL